MSQFDPIIEAIKGEDLNNKGQLMSYLANAVEKSKLTKEDKTSLTNLARSEIKYIAKAIFDAKTYKEKDMIFNCLDCLLGIVMRVYPEADEVPEDMMSEINILVEVMNKERVIENTIDKIFQSDVIEEAYIERLVSLLNGTSDEYQKGRLYAGLLHYQNDISKMTKSAKEKMSAYLKSEFERYLSMDKLQEECYHNLEIAADICRHFEFDGLADILSKVIVLGDNDVNYYCVKTLLELNKPFDKSVVVSLANDLVYADMTYYLMKNHGKSELFPSELANEEYLAKSNMVHWLIYPTELGKEPDKIEYIGKVKYLFKKEVFHVFKFMSDSDNLGDDLKGKWLIGWASDEGGTFSNFDLYSDYEKSTVKDTLKNIKKKLLG